ncbi:UDP-glucose/GDP-mannose dehydrogenase family protein [Paenibacillus sp. KQZ6P-2]|uniref:UDP-glucose 6-dehydrogenase n=1 Tax=Paenibacillus mangrovi TaxID=2931978 RepID=A0A9X1WL93_9BACL|nr:UDP-glucose/GDP-mannose dehydrogenase family protein [Paenibacillus mangrovi]MCJ8010959.1 UDP-glucose/GDP-mannose dehydrogenase family protein [Paenibacillus mangrovi]
MMKVVCVGSGYVGSVTAAAFAFLGHDTTVIDIDPNKIKLIQSGKSPIYEPELDQLISMTIGKTLHAETKYDSVNHADIIFICVGTPSKADGTVDMTYVTQVAEQIASRLNPESFTVIVNKSTVPVGTADRVTGRVRQKSGLQAGVHFSVVSNPEFLREGCALEDVFFPDRIVIGSESDTAKTKMRELYGRLLERHKYKQWSETFSFLNQLDKPPAIYFETDSKSAEMIKYASNAFLSVKISYINEIARLCDALGAQVQQVAKGMGLDGRIGSKFLQVSSGWGGSCFPKDTIELLSTSQKYGRELTVVKAAIDSNLAMHKYCVDKIRDRLKSLNGKTVGILGLTFKPNTDDARKSQAQVIIARLLELGANVKVHDPKGMEMFQAINSELQITYCENPEETAQYADAIVLLTHWDQYLQLDWKEMYKRMSNPYILDTRNVLPRPELIHIGFQVEGLGTS